MVKNQARQGMAMTCITALSFCILAFSPDAWAQSEKKPQKSPMIADVQQLQEVVVTATRRDSSIMDVPFSVNVQSEQDIQRLNTFNLEDLSRNVAGLAIQNLGPGQSVVNIRGVSSGQIVRDQPGVKEQVGIYLDDTPISLSLFTPDIDLYDVSRVETLRGPQGTLFGSGSIGGTVRYITNQPQLNVNEAKAQLDLNTIDGGSNGGHFKTAFNAPIGEKAAVRVVTYGTQYAGFIDALREGGGVNNDVNDGDRWGGRIAFLWQPTSKLSVTPRILYQNIDMGGFNREEFFNLFANPYSSNTIRPGQLGRREQFLMLNETFEDETMILDNVIKWNFNNLLEATYVVSYTKRDLLVSRDASALIGSVNVELEFPTGDVNLPSNLRDTTNLEKMTHELRFSSNNDGALQWLAGVFYSNSNRAYSQRYPMPGWDSVYNRGGVYIGDKRAGQANNGFDTTDSPYVSDLTYDLRQVAVFGEATYTFFDRLGLTAGLRWYDWKEDKTFKSGGVLSNHQAGYKGQNQNVTVSSDGFAPRFMVSYDVTDHVAVNAQASRGFRLGGVNDPLNRGVCREEDFAKYGGYKRFKDETLWNYEVGVKSSFKRVTLNGSFFYIDIDSLGVNVDAGKCSSRVAISVPEAHTMGGELELSVQPMDSLLVTFAGSYVQAEFDSTITNPDTGAVVEGIKDGNRIPSVPDWQLSASATYTLPGILRANESYVSTSWQFVGDRITQSGDQESTKFPPDQSFAGLTKGDRLHLNFRDKMELDAYHLLNLSTGLVYDSWEFMFYVRNVADENPKLSFDRERGGLARLAYRVGQPRTFGLLTRIYF